MTPPDADSLTQKPLSDVSPVCVFAADVPGLPVLPGVARSDGLYQPARLHVLQRLVHVSEHQLGGGSQPLPGPASVRYVS